MNVRHITDSVYYTGVNDRRTHRFEGLWPLPDGVSYNSYLIADEHPVIIDSVEIGFCKDLIDHIHEILPGKSPEYLVVNHMEPDHSGALPVLMDIFPNIKVVGNRQTVEMIKGFYRSVDTNRLITVADGDTICIGKHTLRFLLTPMVHWPETMMTYLEGDGTLFSGDAFGTFGALNGSVTDADIDLEYYIDEMYRYYSNIVGKYGRFVVRALDKVASSGIDVRRLCTTHGPVWERQAAKVIEIYGRLARYEAAPGVVIAYGSMYGNTAEAANYLASRLAEHNVEVRLHDLTSSSLSYVLSDIFRFNGLVVASPTYSMELFPPAESLMKALTTREVKGRVFGTLGSYTWAPGVVVKKLAEYACALGWEVTASAEIRQSLSSDTMDALDNMAIAIADKVKAQA